MGKRSAWFHLDGGGEHSHRPALTLLTWNTGGAGGRKILDTLQALTDDRMLNCSTFASRSGGPPFRRRVARSSGTPSRRRAGGPTAGQELLSLPDEHRRQEACQFRFGTGCSASRLGRHKGAIDRRSHVRSGARAPHCRHSGAGRWGDRV